ncbi:alpha/beta hydrolase [Ramlibacter humi]|uniref:Alpha/beta hydrolase n=1 Tax=Ramlibacter humi TaxID=2530451 RepID=A0A4Z0C8F0_9BURK|nr:alpha/beta hydrolase [Ramlibacter humi]
MFLGPLPRRQLLRTPAGRIEYVLSGEGPLTLLLFNGAGVTAEDWSRLYPGIESIGRVLAWNRAGVGRSAKPVSPQTGSVVVDSTRALLDALQLKPPYLLVGHSLGGLHAQLFARRFPHDVAGVLLLEATHPRDREQLKGHEGHLAKVLSRVLSLPQKLFRANLHSEMDWIDATAREVETAPPFPAVPLAVMSGGNDPPVWLVPPEVLRARRAHQRELAMLSPRGRQVIARRSGHFPQLTQPSLVLEVLRELGREALVEHVGRQQVEDGGEHALELADGQRVRGPGAERRGEDAARRDDHQPRQPDVAERGGRQVGDLQAAGDVARDVGHRDGKAERGGRGHGVVDGDVAPGHERHADEAAAGAHQP